MRTLIALMLIMLPLLGSCNELKDWRDNQIRTSHNLANAGKLSPPAKPISIPGKITNQLPWNSGFVVITFTESRGEVEITAIAPDDTLKTTKWMLTKLAQLGYNSGDNPSRILEGVEYTSAKGMYERIFVKVTMNVHEQCVVELKAFEREDDSRGSR